MRDIINKIWIYVIGPENDPNIIHIADGHNTGKGFSYKGKEFVHHAKLHHHETAFYNLIRKQKFILATVTVVLLISLFVNWHNSLIVIFSTITIIYFIDLLFSVFITYRTFKKRPEITVQKEEINDFSKYQWPVYTIFCPLYKEWQVVPQFVEAMENLDYPDDKLQVMFLLEENDPETIAKIRAANLPPHFEIVVVPHSNPKTKPKAMNYGLQYARGEYIVIYDAEDVPEPDQLKKAVIAFKKVPENIVCIQAKLNFYNPRQNILTRIFAAEYSLWFDLVLPGLQSISAPIPLGGTSNHFKANILLLLGGWDAFNVTEDCDLGMRISRRGYRTAIIDSTTHEEANSELLNWFSQRSRWIKGYIQTYFVHMRHPIKLIREGKGRDLFLFQLIVGGKVVSLFVNPIMWITTVCYFVFRAEIGPFIETLFPGPILYIGVFSLIFGNFLSLYYYMIGCAKRGYDGLIKYVFLVPFYWLGMSIAAWRAAYEIVVKPHYWAKTTHGLHLAKSKEKSELTTGVMGEAFGFLKTGAGILVISSVFANVLNLIFNIYLGRELTLAQFGVVTIVSTFSYLLSLFSSALSTTVNRTISFLEGRHPGSGNQFFRSKGVFILLAGVLSSAVWIIFVPAIAQFFQISSLVVIISFAPAIIFGALDSFNRGYFHGTLSFRASAMTTIAEVISKLGFVVVLVWFGLNDLAPLAIPASIIVAGVGSTIGALYIFRVRSKNMLPTTIDRNKFPFGFYAASLMSGISLAAFLSIDVVLAKHYLSPDDAGRYALLSLVGKMIFFFGSLLNVFIVTFTSRTAGEGKNPIGQFKKIFLGTVFLTFSAGIGLYMFGSFLIPLLLGEQARSILPYIPAYSTAIVLFTLSTSIVIYRLSQKNYLFPALSLLMSIFVWKGIVDTHTSIEAFVGVISIANIFYFVTVVLAHVFYSQLIYVYRNIYDVLSVVKKLPTARTPLPGQSRILIFNWRDTENVFAGGAETYIHALAKRFVQAGHSVTLFTSNDGKQNQNGEIDGVRVIRRGGFYGVYVAAFVYYIFKFRNNFDVIIDCENGIPFFTPLYAKEPVFCLIHHIHQHVFRKALILPLAIFASFLEKRLMPLVYRHCNFITVSESSKLDMETLRITDKEITVVYPGIDLSFLSPGRKSPTPLVSYVGRLKDYKSVDLLLKAFVRIRTAVPNARLIIAGGGEEGENLSRLAEKLQISECVSFLGKVSEEKKRDIFRTSWVVVNPSMMEGWGITTIEANACGTTVVASDVPGLRDSVQNGLTGVLVSYGKINAFAETIIDLLTDNTLRKTLEENAIVWAENFDWQKSSDAFINILFKQEFSVIDYKTPLADPI